MNSFSVQYITIPPRKRFWLIIIILICLFTTSTPLGFMIGNTNLEIIMISISIFLSFNYFFKFNYSVLIFLFLLIAIIQIVVYPDRFFNWCRLVLVFWSLRSLFILTLNKGFDISNIFYKSLFRILCISFTIYLVVEIIKIPIPYITYDSGWMNIYNLYLGGLYTNVSDFSGGSQIVSLLGFSFKRNYGLFTEPGLLAVFLNILLFLNLFVLSKRNKHDVFIILLMLISTYSTTGIVTALIMIAFYVYIGSKYYFRVFLFITIPLLLLYVINALLVEKQANAEGSWVARSFDLVASINLFLKSPLWGWGFENHDIYRLFSANLLYERPSSNGLTSILYQLGIIGLLVYVIPFKRFYKLLQCKKERNIFCLFVVIFVILLMGEPIQYNAIVIAILSFFDAKFHTSNIYYIYEYKK